MAVIWLTPVMKWKKKDNNTVAEHKYAYFPTM